MKILKQHSIKIAYVAITIFILSVFAYQYKVAFLSWNVETQKFTPSNALFDDGGLYISIFHVAQNGDRFINQPWFQAIRDNISEETLLQQWGQWAPRVKHFFSSSGQSPYSAWMQALVVVNKVVGDINFTFTVSLLIFPVFLFLKYFILLPTCVQKQYLLPVIIINLFYDVSSVPFFQSASIFAMQAFLAGLSSVVFGKQGAMFRWIGWGLIFTSAFLDIVMIPAALGTMFGYFFHKYSPIRINQKYFLLIALGCIAVTYLAAASWLVRDIFEYGKFYYNGAVRTFNRNARYGDFQIIGLLLLVHYLSTAFPSLTSRRLEKIKYVIVTLLAGSVLLVLLAPLMSFEFRDNGGRVDAYIFIMLLFALAAIYVNLKEARLQNIATKISAALLFFFYLNFFLSPNVLKISKYVPFEPSHFPTKEISESGVEYYLAQDPQQVYGYFIKEYYDEAPLILNVSAPNYSKEKIIAASAGIVRS